MSSALGHGADAIEVGDLVRVVGCGCVHGTNLVGRVFVVPAINVGFIRCTICNFEGGCGRRVMDPLFEGACFDVSWLKKIPPIEGLQDTEQHEEIAA